MKKRATAAKSVANLTALRLEITELVAKNAVPMVQQAIDAVNEEGQYQGIKFLFEMVGLYPAVAQDESPVQDSLARTLLERLGLSEAASQDPVSGGQEPVADRHPLE